MRLREPSTWRNSALVLGFLLATAMGDGCGVAKTTLTARCGFVVTSPDDKRVCAYDPSSCKPIIKTDTCAGSDGNQYGNFTSYLWLCSYSTSQCQDVSNSVSDTFNKVYSDHQETYKNAVFFSNARSIQETGLYCYDTSSKQELGVVAIASSRHCIYDTSCNVAPWTDATKAVDIVNDYYTVNSSMVLSGLGITALGPDLASDFNKNNTYSNLDLTKNQLTDLASTKFPSSLMVMDVSQNNLTSIAKIQATNLNALRASSNAITTIGELPSGLWSLVLEFNQITTLDASSLPPQLITLNLFNNELTSVRGSFPSSFKNLILPGNKLTTFPAESLGANLEQLDLGSNQLAKMPDLSKLAKLAIVKLQNNALTSLGAFPSNVTTIFAGSNKLTSFPTNLPPSVQTLDLSLNNVAWQLAPSVLPLNVTNLNLSGNPVRDGFLNASLLPFQLKSLDLSACGIASIVGDFPPQLTRVLLSGNPIASFPLSTATATLFRAIPNGLVLPEKILSLNCSTSSQLKLLAGNATVVFCPDATYIAAGSDVVSSSKGWFFGVGAGVVLVVLVAVVVLYRKRLVRSKALSKLLEDFASNRSRQSKLDSMAGFEFTATPGIAESAAGLSRFETDLLDSDLAEHRIPLNDVKILGPLHGKHKNASVPGTMMLYKAEFDGRLVVLKTLMTDTHATGALAAQADAFLAVITLRARLDHPNIVTFIGAVWSSNVRKGMLGFGFLSEHMAKGDLGRLLTLDQSRSSAERLFKWMPRSSNALPKLSLVSDIALAIVCLHSFAPAIMHRNLHARHVLLTDEYVAKLSGFRPQDDDESDDAAPRFVPDRLLTPPEVLKGDEWTEKADIYAFGILICEVDLGHHPYAHTIKTGDAEDASQQIATLVMADLLQPTFSVECPIDVQDVAKKCLAHCAEDRPSAVQMEYWLRKLRLSY